MLFASANALPRSNSTHSLRFMPQSLSYGYDLSISVGQYDYLPNGYLIGWMQTVFETRRIRLDMLIAKHGKIADLNRALGWEETNGRLYQIHNRSVRSDRGTLYELGDPTAREIEKKLNLEEGWMDTPPSLGEQYGQDDPRAMVWDVVAQMPQGQLETAYRLLNALVNPNPNFTTRPAIQPWLPGDELPNPIKKKA
jgi:hypothetical protein